MKFTAKFISLLLLAQFVFVPNVFCVESSRLAILSETETSQAADVLTATLSKNEKLSLLERAEIDKVLREQKLSASGAAKEALKLGQLLGADGLLILDLSQEGTNTFLNARLVAVKPGVILSAVPAPWPLKDATEWTKMIGHRFEPLLPKLSVPTKDALPISILNFRAAANSSSSRQTERELTLLLVNRLMRERELFVLERRHMEALSTEKELSGNENSPFWNGAYLLEGAIDKAGFIAGKITISARFSPPGGGEPTDIEVSGPRKDLVKVAEQMTAKILETLKKTSSAPEWKPADEAARYFEEAKWALKWSLWKEAQTAAESSWTLGKRDMDGAMVRIKAYAVSAWPDPGGYTPTFAHLMFDDKTQVHVEKEVAKLLVKQANSRGGFALDLSQRAKGIVHHVVSKPADPKKVDEAQHVLELYFNFSQALGADEPKFNTPWYLLGLDALDVASATLQHFHFARKSRPGVEDRLAELRALTRSVAAWIMKSPSVGSVYFINDRIATSDELYRIQSGRNIFLSLADNGCFWQETPEECVALYRQLMGSAAFPALNQSLWMRRLERPLLISWNPSDEKSIPTVWRTFLSELAGSTNLAARIEGKFLELDAARSDSEVEAVFEATFDLILTNRDTIVAMNVPLFFDYYNLSELIHSKDIEKLSERYGNEIRPRLEEVKNAHEKLIRERQKKTENQAAFEKQKEYLQQNTTFQFSQFSGVFRHRQYSVAEARELRPLLLAYKSNVVAQAEGKTGREKGMAQSAIGQIGLLINNVDRVLDPPAPKTNAVASVNNAPKPVAAIPPANQPKATTTQIPVPLPKKVPSQIEAIAVRTFFKVPDERFDANSVSELRAGYSGYSDGRIWLSVNFRESHPNANFSDRQVQAALNPEKGLWRFVEYPKPDWDYLKRTRYFDSEVFQEALYASASDGIKKFDFKIKKWEALNIPVQEAGNFFTVRDRLFFANGNSIIELLDGGRETRVLASTRRRPAVSLLDSSEGLGNPVIFPGPDQSVRISFGKKIFTWDGTDWKEQFTFPQSVTAKVREDATILAFENRQFWLLPHQQTNAELCLNLPVKSHLPLHHPAFMPINKPTNTEPPTVWKTEDYSLNIASVETMNGDLYFFQEHMMATNVAGQWQIAERNGRHADLVCFLRGATTSVVIPLKFDLDRGPLESREIAWKRNQGIQYPPYWIVFTPENLVIGQGMIPGFWSVPRKEIDAAVSQQKKLILQQQQAELAVLEAMRKHLRDTYDQNKDGIFAPAEKEKMLSDPKWIEVTWSGVDTNENGFLDGQDNLLVFDPNENGTLEDHEVAAMDQAQAHVAAMTLRQFDRDENGRLDNAELKKITERELEITKSKRLYFDHERSRDFDEDKDGKFNLAELKAMQNRLTRSSIFAAVPRKPGSPPPVWNPSQDLQKALEKSGIEAIWQQQRMNPTKPDSSARKQ